ncbi:hypothetical protein [Protofrankia coriariae]|nr:hypothetical protein [Protofrankia coriariae]
MTAPNGNNHNDHENLRAAMTAARTPGTGGPAGPAAPWHILIVCTGNLCRSPMAQYLATALLQEALGTAAAPGVTVTSAGTSAHDGTPIHPHAASVLAGRGLDPRAFTTRRLHVGLLDSADLVLCAERGHRAAVVTTAPKTVSRTFTLREFARVTAGLTPADISPGTAYPGGARNLGGARPATDPLRREPLPPTPETIRMCGQALVSRALARRGLRRPATPADDDIPDPIGSTVETFRMCAEQIGEALAQPLELLARAASGIAR